MNKAAALAIIPVFFLSSCAKPVTPAITPVPEPVPSLIAAPVQSPSPSPLPDTEPVYSPVPDTAETPVPLPCISSVINDIRLERIMSDIGLFCETDRLSGSAGEIAALEYADKTYVSLGLETQKQKVVHEGEYSFETYNAIGVKKSSRESAPIIILCAHADSVLRSAGATDNAAGLAVMLEAARQTAELAGDAAEVRYIAFCAEEWQMLGSSFYVNSLTKEEKSRVAGVLNLDMFSSKNQSDLYAYFESNETGFDFWNKLIGAAKIAGTEIFIKRTHEIGSDSIPFEKAGMPAVLITHNIVNDEYHTREDTPDKVDELKLKVALDLSTAWIGMELEG